MSAKFSILLAVTLVAFTACNRAKTKRAEQQPPTPASFHETLFTSITPTADGGAYAIGLDSGLWYVRGSQAVRVRFPDKPAQNAETFFLGLEITPLLDGGAYAHSLLDKSFWHLRADTATRVTEVSSLSSAPAVGPVSAFPLYVAERQKRLQAERKLEDRPSPDDAPPPD